MSMHVACRFQQEAVWISGREEAATGAEKERLGTLASQLTALHEGLGARQHLAHFHICSTLLPSDYLGSLGMNRYVLRVWGGTVMMGASGPARLRFRPLAWLCLFACMQGAIAYPFFFFLP